MKPDVDLHVERLVLDGLSLDADAGQRLRAVMETELSRLLTEHGLPGSLQAGAEIASLNAGRVSLGSSARPESAGTDIAKAVYGGLSRG
jgi:hypothetical protein